MPKKSGHRKKRASKKHKAATAKVRRFTSSSGGHHARLRKHEERHPAPKRKTKRKRAQPAAPRQHSQAHTHGTSARGPQKRRSKTTSRAAQARLKKRITAATLRDLMALNCVRRCTH